jgi:hypothetical protein
MRLWARELLTLLVQKFVISEATILFIVYF